jgi:hypothetical protein
MGKAIYSDAVAGLLFVSGIFHIAAPRLTERWMSRKTSVRSVGALLLAIAVPCLVWPEWYFWILFAGLTASGLWRLLFPQSSIRAQQRSYPRWVHGCLMVGGAVLIWVLHP